MGINRISLFPASVHPMKTESRSETPPEDPARAVLAAWQRLAVALAVVATLAGLALGGFAGAVDPPPDTVSAATPQPRSLVAGTEAPAGSLVGDPKLGDSTAEDSLVWDPEGGRRGIEGGAERTERGSGGGSEGGSRTALEFKIFALGLHLRSKFSENALVQNKKMPQMETQKLQKMCASDVLGPSKRKIPKS